MKNANWNDFAVFPHRNAPLTQPLSPAKPGGEGYEEMQNRDQWCILGLSDGTGRFHKLLMDGEHVDDEW